jgi:hypothetical protein
LSRLSNRAKFETPLCRADRIGLPPHRLARQPAESSDASIDSLPDPVARAEVFNCRSTQS